MTAGVPAEAVVAAAREQIDTPWQHQGRLPGRALDCAGLVICVARQLALVPPDWDIANYSRSPDGTLIGLCNAHMQPVDLLQIGAVLVAAVEDDPCHLGIVADYRHGGLSLVHACVRAGRVIETRLVFARRMRLRGIYWLPGVLPAE